MTNIAVIPARGGSKRIPRKNIKMFHGQPLISYSIEAAIKSNCFDRVIVSTDDEEIAEVALSFGAEVPFLRSKELSNDFAGTTPVIQESFCNYYEVFSASFRLTMLIKNQLACLITNLCSIF